MPRPPTPQCYSQLTTHSGASSHSTNYTNTCCAFTFQNEARCAGERVAVNRSDSVIDWADEILADRPVCYTEGRYSQLRGANSSMPHWPDTSGIQSVWVDCGGTAGNVLPAADWLWDAMGHWGLFEWVFLSVLVLPALATLGFARRVLHCSWARVSILLLTWLDFVTDLLFARSLYVDARWQLLSVSMASLSLSALASWAIACNELRKAWSDERVLPGSSRLDFAKLGEHSAGFAAVPAECDERQPARAAALA